MPFEVVNADAFFPGADSLRWCLDDGSCMTLLKQIELTIPYAWRNMIIRLSKYVVPSSCTPCFSPLELRTLTGIFDKRSYPTDSSYLLIIRILRIRKLNSKNQWNWMYTRQLSLLAWYATQNSGLYTYAVLHVRQYWWFLHHTISGHWSS